jgi:hypothetical protein
VTNPPQTAREVQAAIDAGLATWEEIIAALRDFGISDAAVAEWRAGDRTVGEVVVNRAMRGLE